MKVRLDFRNLYASTLDLDAAVELEYLRLGYAYAPLSPEYDSAVAEIREDVNAKLSRWVRAGEVSIVFDLDAGTATVSEQPPAAKGA